MIEYSDTQKNRLVELGMEFSQLNQEFSDAKEREQQYKLLEKEYVKKNKNILKQLLEDTHRPKLCKLQEDLAKCLCSNGFTQVTTPTIISKQFLERMTIDGTHPLNSQVFWIDQKSCLRPMLAPNLYSVSKDLMNCNKGTLRVFEIGSCFRKESEGNSHLKEFTMLNLVEWGTPKEKRLDRLIELSKLVLEAADIKDYKTEIDNSVVYGEGIDIVGSNGLELASTSIGPHKLDIPWKINSTWVGVGFGLERLLMYRQKQQGIHRYAKSISYLNGARLNVK